MGKGSWGLAVQLAWVGGVRLAGPRRGLLYRFLHESPSPRISVSICLTPTPLLPCRSEYKSHFSPRDLRAFSVEPLLIYPTHYTGDDGYVSDTETSVVWNNEHVKTDWDRAKSQKMREQQALSREAKNSDVLQSPLDSAARDEL